MSYTMARASVPAFEIALNALSVVLEKGEAFAAEKKIEPSVLLGSRLAPDMFPLVRQVQIATDTAKRGAARLAENLQKYERGEPCRRPFTESELP